MREGKDSRKKMVEEREWEVKGWKKRENEGEIKRKRK